MSNLHKYVDLTTMDPIPSIDMPFTTVEMVKLKGHYAVMDFIHNEIHASNISSKETALQITAKLNEYINNLHNF